MRVYATRGKAYEDDKQIEDSKDSHGECDREGD
jgi:hypothetical protein